MNCSKVRFYFDVETKGRCEVAQLCPSDDPISLAVGMWDDEVPITFTNDPKCLQWLERQPESCYGSLQDLIQCLDSAQIIVAYNHNFDMGSLLPYCEEGTYAAHRAQWELKSIDPFDIILEETNQMVGLGDVAKLNLENCRKLGKSMDAPVWWENGNIDLLETYCRADVTVTKRIYEIKTKTLIPEKFNQKIVALSESDVRRAIVEREQKLFATTTTTSTSDFTMGNCFSQSRLRNINYDTIEKILHQISVLE